MLVFGGVSFLPVQAHRFFSSGIEGLALYWGNTRWTTCPRHTTLELRKKKWRGNTGKGRLGSGMRGLWIPNTSQNHEGFKSKRYMIPVRGSLPPPPPHMVWSQNLRFAAFRMKTLYLQCFLHGGLLVRSATLQIRWIFATNLPKTCYLQCFGFDIVE